MPEIRDSKKVLRDKEFELSLKSLENDDLRREFYRLKQRFTDIVCENYNEIDKLKYEKEKKFKEMETLSKRSKEEIQFIEKKIGLLKSEMFNIMEKRTNEENVLITTMQKYLDPHKEVKEQLRNIIYSQILVESYEKVTEEPKLEKWRHIKVPDEFKENYNANFK